MIKLIVITNLLLFILMGIDKFLAIKNLSRIPEKYLLLIGLISGFGGILSMFIFRHKTRKTKFLIVFILGLIFNIFIISKVGLL